MQLAVFRSQITHLELHSIMTKLEQRFRETLDFIKHADGDFNPSNQLKLDMYALYKQATEGDVHGKKPGLVDVVGKAKYTAWSKLKGTSCEQAMQQYVDEVDAFRDSLN